MARGEGDTSLRSNFVERVVKLPIVNVAWGYATNTYTHIKESNKLVNFTLTNAERSVNFVAGQAKPVVRKFEKQIQAVDDLACKGLGTLEEKVPYIKKPADEIIGDTRKLYTNTVHSRLEGILNFGTGAVTSLTSYGRMKVDSILSNQLVQSAVTFVDDVVIGTTEGYIDRFLPPDTKEKDARKKEKEERTSTLFRLINIARTVRNRTYRQLVLKVEYAQEWALDLIISYPVEMIELSKGRINAAIEYASKLWVTLTQEKSDNEKAEEKSQVLGALNVVKDRALWAFGMLRVVPSLLPMYLVGFLSLLKGTAEEKKRKETIEQPKEDSKENGSVLKNKNNRSANYSSHNSSKAGDKSEQNCHNSIPEEHSEHDS